MTSSLNDNGTDVTKLRRGLIGHCFLAEISVRSCWATGEDSCNDPGPNQHRICTCSEDLCNCYAEAGDEGESQGCRMPPTARLQQSAAVPLAGGGGCLAKVLALSILLLSSYNTCIQKF